MATEQYVFDSEARRDAAQSDGQDQCGVSRRAGLRIVAQKRLQDDDGAGRGVLWRAQASGGSFRDLVNFMTSGPVVVQVLEGEPDAVAKHREIMGATNPAQCGRLGTIRASMFAESIEANSAHGSDSAEAAAQEIAFFFSGVEIVG